MAEHSWLKDAKHVSDLGSHCVNLDWYKDESWKREELANKKWRELEAQPLPVEPAYQPFFQTRNLHDSYVVGHQSGRDSFKLTLDSVWDHDFVHEVAEWREEDSKSFVIPVGLVFHQVHHVRWMRPQPDGMRRFSRPDWRPLDDERRQSDTFLFSWFVQEHGRLQWIAAFHSFKTQSHRLSSMLYLGIDCERVSAVDRREVELRRHLGDRAADLWKKFRSQHQPRLKGTNSTTSSGRRLRHRPRHNNVFVASRLSTVRLHPPLLGRGAEARGGEGQDSTCLSLL